MKHLHILMLGLISFWSISGSAAPVSPATKNEIEQNQQALLEQLEQSEKELKSLTPMPTLPEQEEPAAESRCFNIQSLTFTGNTVFTDAQLLEVVKFTPNCLGLNGINRLLSQISNYYIKQGYVSSRAFLVPQDLTLGVLEIVIIEGKLESILLNGQPMPNASLLFAAQLGQVLNLRDIEQGLDQINRLARFNAQIKLLPGSEEGFTQVDIQTQDNGVASSSLGVNNGGSDNTGETQLSGNVSLSNIINMLDSWRLSASKSSEFSNSNDAESLHVSIDLPFGYHNLSYHSGYSAYINTFPHNNFQVRTHGKTNTHRLGWQWLLHRDSVSKTKLNTALSHRREKNYIMGSLLNNSSRELSHLSFGLEYSTRFGKSFITVLPQYSRGVSWLDGEQDRDKDGSAPKAQFDKGSLTLSVSYPISEKLGYRSTLFGQWSNDTLYGNQRISIGGEYSVRGFKKSAISGDEGYYWRNGFSYALGQYPWVGQLSAEWALDSGTIVSDIGDQYEEGSLLGTALTLQTRSSRLSTSLALGAPLQSPSRMNNDDYVIYYRLDVAL